jgi:hypothetical protein
MEIRLHQPTRKPAPSLRQTDNIQHLPMIQLWCSNLLRNPVLRMRVRQQVWHLSTFNKRTSHLHQEHPARVPPVHHLYLKVGSHILTAILVNIITSISLLRAHNGSSPRVRRR